MAKKEITPPPKQLSEAEIESESLDLSAKSLQDQANRTLKPGMVLILKKLAHYIAKVGLPLQEACILVDIDYEKLKEQMKVEPLIAKIIKAKELEYKKDLLHTISNKGKNGDDKIAQWLLAKRYPDEYGDAKRGEGEGGEDFMFEAIKFIRKNGDNSPMVNEVSGQAIIVKRTGAMSGVTEKIGDIMGTFKKITSPKE